VDLNSELFRELTAGLPRQGPGSTAATLRALATVTGLPERPRILDIGCGPGAQTIDLARATGGSIVALDLLEPLLVELRERAERAGVAAQITTVRQSMMQMNFAAEEFDLIWSEGAIYIMGFAAGLAAARPFLKRGGSLVCSELTWLTGDPPAAAREYWAENYPAMRTVDSNRQTGLLAGYTNLETFILPVSDWWRNYYEPAETRLLEVRARHAADPALVNHLDDIRREYDLFRDHADSYGYVFYVMRKP
jgi:ubiquinone/menaquinone biosynthesis C-methylase UbiE